MLKAKNRMSSNSQRLRWRAQQNSGQDPSSDPKAQCLNEFKDLSFLDLNLSEILEYTRDAPPQSLNVNTRPDDGIPPADSVPGTPVSTPADFVGAGVESEDSASGASELIQSVNSVASAIVPSWNVPGGSETSELQVQAKKKGAVSASRVRYRGLLFAPSEPSILANKYLVMGLVDASTAHALHVHTHQRFHIKLVTSKAASEVGAQQAMLDCDVGVRSPVEIVRPPHGDRAWLVFEPHCGDLHSYVRQRRRLREAESQRLFTQIATTVHKCHQVGLILRDLKLRKFVFTHSSREEVVLESLEDSVLAGDSDLLHDKHGCPAYVAPEILTSSSYSGKHADMWGLGVILYTMLIGRYPFHNSDTTALFAKIRHGKYTLPDWISSRARHLIMGLLRKKPSLRLSAQEVLQHPWLTRPPRDHSSKDMHEHAVPQYLPKQFGVKKF